MNLNQKPYIPALFLHIQKTAGTSIVNAAYGHYESSVISHGGCWGRTPDSLKNIGFVSGHVGYDFCQSLLPDRFSFTFLRDPVERVVSMYYFCKAQDPSLYKIYERANTLDLKEFLDNGVHYTIDSSGSLDTKDYGYDISGKIAEWALFDVQISRFWNKTHGIIGEYTEVIVCKKYN